MSDEKNTAISSHREKRVEVVASEYEPTSSAYKAQQKAWAAIFALAMGNVCAAMSSTESFLLVRVEFPW